MKRDICGIEVIAENSSLSKRLIKKNCIYAESLIKAIKETTSLEPLSGIEKIVINEPCKNIEKNSYVVDLRGLETGKHEKRKSISCSCPQKAGLCYDDSIHLDADIFSPLNAFVFIHEVGHNVHKLLASKKKGEVTKKYSCLKDDLIKGIREGSCPSEAANSIMAEYAFLHEFGFSKDDLICFKGYVGILSRIVKAMPYTENAIKSYTFHGNDHEFFAEMFAMYFIKREALGEKGLLDFAEKIIKG